jgi:two-component system, OmpR family, phosphate regulon sensor histidine kinase PhoR
MSIDQSLAEWTALVVRTGTAWRDSTNALLASAMIIQTIGQWLASLRSWANSVHPTQARLRPTLTNTVAPRDATKVEFEPPAWSVILDGIIDPALFLDNALVVHAANDEARDTIGAALGQHIAQTNRSPELLLAVEGALATGIARSFQLRLPVPVERLLNGRVTPLRPKVMNGGGPALLIVLRDLTEQDQLTRLRADFVANASHELRTPLASLKGYVETLQGAAKDDPVARAKFLPIMLAQADRMSRLIEDLLSLSRIEMREHVPPRDAVDLSGLVTEVAGICRPLAEAAGCSLMLAPLPSEAVVLGDHDELLQVAHNLIQNAVKYGRPGGRIDVALTDLGARLSLTVTDDGIGIAAQHLPRLTERFYRVSAKDSRERGGTGLGLAIVKHIVNRHRGELRISSTLGKGSEFVVLLPRA